MAWSSQFFFLKTISGFTIVFFINGLRGWMDNDFIPFKDIFLFVFVALAAIWLTIFEKFFVIFGRVLKIWKLEGEDLLVKTTTTSTIKNKSDLIRYLYQKQLEKTKDGTKLEVTSELIDEFVKIMK